MKPSKGLRTYLAVSSLIICIMALPEDAGAVCSTEERRDMAIDGMSRAEIDRGVCGTRTDNGHRLRHASRKVQIGKTTSIFFAL
jgi:hypothetical protein